MARVRAELGLDALILATRRVTDGVELTAALEPDDEPPPLADPERPRLLAWHGVPAPLADRLARSRAAAGAGRRAAFGTLGLDGAGAPADACRAARRGQDAERGAPGDPAGDGRGLAAGDHRRRPPRRRHRAVGRLHPPAGPDADRGQPPGDACPRAAAPSARRARADRLRPARTRSTRRSATRWPAWPPRADAAVALVLPAGLDPGESADLARRLRGGGRQPAGGDPAGPGAPAGRLLAAATRAGSRWPRQGSARAPPTAWPRSPRRCWRTA